MLASSSPRRIGFLHDLGLTFEAVAPDVDETVPPGASAEWLVADLAESKARSVAQLRPGALVIAADTVVSIDGEILGKPGDVAEARTMLIRLAGRVHNVHTGLAILDERETRIDVVASAVTMRDYRGDALEAYLATGESLDKAGAYGIQGEGSGLVASVSGCYTNVAGLPLCRLTAVLSELGIAGITPIRCGDAPDHRPA